MCNRLPEIKKNGDAGIFPVYYSLNGTWNDNCRNLLVIRVDNSRLCELRLDHLIEDG